MSELSLVLLALGRNNGDVSDNVIGIAAFAFSFLAVGSTYAILGNDLLFRKLVPCSASLGLRDLDHAAVPRARGRRAAPHLSAGFFLDRQFPARRN